MKVLDPTDITDINAQARVWARNGETIVPIRIKHIIVGEDVIDAVADVTRCLSRRGKVLMVVDRTLMRRRGDELKPLIEDALRRVVPLTVACLPDDRATEFHADLEAAEDLAIELEDHAALVAVGSGSITDVAKYARHLAAQRVSRRIPLICVPTAASMTGYTSAMAVLNRDGCKRSFPAASPDAVVCDLRTLAAAPPAMTQAGFADVLARSLACGDWFLAGQLGMDDSFSEVPGRLMESAEQQMIDMADEVATGDLEGIRAVTEALLLAGISVLLVNHRKSISGWGHAISHYLDMTTQYNDCSAALYGGRLGVAALTSARAYERTWAELDWARIRGRTTTANMAAARRTIERVFGAYDPSGHLWAEIYREYESKIRRWCAAEKARRLFVERKRAGEYDDILCAMVRPSAAIRDALSRAGAPQRFADLDKPVARHAAHEAVCYGHLIRERFTLGDLLAQSAWLTSETALSLLDEPA